MILVANLRFCRYYFEINSTGSSIEKLLTFFQIRPLCDAAYVTISQPSKLSQTCDHLYIYAVYLFPKALKIAEAGLEIRLHSWAIVLAEIYGPYLK